MPGRLLYPEPEGALVTRDRDGIPYTIQQWYEGRECDTRSREDIFRSIRMLAQIHAKMQMPVVEFYVEPSLEDEYQRHNQELKKIRSFIRKKERYVLLKNCIWLQWKAF